MVGTQPIITLVFLAVPAILAAKDAPTWPDQYQVSFKMDIPYIQRLQTGGLEYTYTFWRDTHHGRQKMVRDGKETQFVFLKEGIKYDIVPAKDHLQCFKSKIGGGSGPTSAAMPSHTPAAPDTSTQRRKLHQEDVHAMENRQWKTGFTPEQLSKLGFLLPDLSEKRWQRNGTVMRDNTPLHRYTYLLHENMGYGTVAGQYDFLVDASGQPRELLMWGINLYTGGHFDDYRVYYTSFHAGHIADDVFDFDSSNCTKLQGIGEDPEHPSHMPGSGAAAAARVLPNVHHGDPEYDAFVHKSGRRHTSVEEYHARKQVYYDNKRVVEECNAANRTYTCAINQFGDWTAEERRTLLRRNGLTGRTTGAQNKEYKYMKPHEPVVPLHFLPTTVDWRGNPADSPVKDQAACGSCWAFSTIQSLESAYFRATGKALLLSEQHLLNCAWNVPQNHGCFGGDQDMALEWVFEEGVIATEEALPYVGVFDYCPSNLTGYVRFEGHWSLVQPAGEKNTMEALLTKGPLTVSIDASADDMTFYKSGIYANPSCATKETELDHAVMLSGYGEEDGHPFWIVKNTWSTYWGEGGYLRVSRAPDDCGIAAQVMYAEIRVLEDVH